MDSSLADYKLISDRQYLVDILLHKHTYAEKVLTNAKVVNVVTKEIYNADIAVAGEYILTIGDCFGLIGPKTEIIDLSGKFVTPGFIDAHMHFESSMLTVTEFTRLSLPTGTTCLVADPHEIGNVLGFIGIQAMCNEAVLCPQHVFFRVPSLIPNCPGLGTSGYTLSSSDFESLLTLPGVIGLGETQGISSIKSVYENNRENIRTTISASVFVRHKGLRVDGNAPELSGPELAAHIIADGTDISCHETTTTAEAVEKLRNGVFLLIREGSTKKNLNECIKAVTEKKLDSRRVILATDDILPEDLLEKGHMNHVVRKAVEAGVDIIEAIQMATVNPATWLNLSAIGVLAPGKYADLNVISGPLEEMNVERVFLKGKLTVDNNKLQIPLKPYAYPLSVKSTIQADAITAEDLRIHSSNGTVTARCIGLIKDQNLTDAIEIELEAIGGYVEPNLKEDVLPIAVVGRHGENGIGKGFVKGFEIKQGAIAETISHDTHNIIVTGTSYNDMAVAVNKLINSKGGIAAVCNGKCVGSISLPIAGLMTDELCADELTSKLKKLHKKVHEQLGCTVHAPFMHLGFLSLTTSPKWKITDKGLIDASNYCVIPAVKH